ncbi:hypothetical protein ZIOFF_008640 [Zingiber officinale]|uniref:Uncharacterized protein n=1 Tax=Zingiber officinale TaxID=94328 RepID=A0A8J5HZ53_ZINOF|nr:hypothetical protein ZIOFF_008640 [Zingiber officinale]
MDLFRKEEGVSGKKDWTWIVISLVQCPYETCLVIGVVKLQEIKQWGLAQRHPCTMGTHVLLCEHGNGESGFSGGAWYSTQRWLLSAIRARFEKVTIFILQQQDSMASENNFMQTVIQRFDDHYDHWSMLMEHLILLKEYWQIIWNSSTAAADAVLIDVQKIELEGRKLEDLKAKYYLFRAIDHPILETILSKETSKDI